LAHEALGRGHDLARLVIGDLARVLVRGLAIADSRLAREDDLVAVDLLHEERLDLTALSDELGVVDLDRKSAKIRSFRGRRLEGKLNRAQVVVRPPAAGDHQQVDIGIVVRLLAARTRSIQPHAAKIRPELALEQSHQAINRATLLRGERCVCELVHASTVPRVGDDPQPQAAKLAQDPAYVREARDVAAWMERLRGPR